MPWGAFVAGPGMASATAGPSVANLGVPGLMKKAGSAEIRNIKNQLKKYEWTYDHTPTPGSPEDGGFKGRAIF
jgi:hypothetical protein